MSVWLIVFGAAFAVFAYGCADVHREIREIDAIAARPLANTEDDSESFESAFAAASSFEITQSDSGLHLLLSSGKIYALEDTESTQNLIRLSGLLVNGKRSAPVDQPKLDGQRRINPKLFSQ